MGHAVTSREQQAKNDLRSAQQGLAHTRRGEEQVERVRARVRRLAHRRGPARSGAPGALRCGTHRTPAARRRRSAGASSRTSSADPGDDGPEPPRTAFGREVLQ